MMEKVIRPAGRLIGLALVLSLTATAVRAESESPQIRVSVIDGRLSVEAEQAPLQKVLEAVARTVGFTVELRGEIPEAVSPAIRDLPIHAAIGELLGDGHHSFFLQFAAREPGETSARLAHLVVIAADSITAQAGSSPARQEPAADLPSEPPGDPGTLDDAAVGEAIEILEELLQEEDAILREAAAEALAELEELAAAVD